MLRLTIQNVFDTISRAVFSPQDLRNGIPADAVYTTGVSSGIDFAFDHEKLLSIQDDVAELLNELPEDFHTTNGCMMSEADHDRGGHTWTTVDEFHIDVLFAVGGALGMIQYRTTPQYTGGYALCARIDTKNIMVPRRLN